MILNIGRQLASGGRQIGEKLAQQLGYQFYDKQLLIIAAKESGIAPELFEKADEQAQRALAGTMIGLRFPAWSSALAYGTGVSNQSLFQIQSDVIRQLADKDNAVFVGRCADYVLRTRTDCVNIFISADWPDRVQRVATRRGITDKQAAEVIEKADEQRRDYYNFYTNKRWGEAESYHLCVNSSVLGIEATTAYILDFIKQVKTNQN